MPTLPGSSASLLLERAVRETDADADPATDSTAPGQSRTDLPLASLPLTATARIALNRLGVSSTAELTGLAWRGGKALTGIPKKASTEILEVLAEILDGTVQNWEGRGTSTLAPTLPAGAQARSCASLPLSCRAVTALASAGVTTVGQAAGLRWRDLHDLPGVWATTLYELLVVLRASTVQAEEALTALDLPHLTAAVQRHPELAELSLTEISLPAAAVEELAASGVTRLGQLTTAVLRSLLCATHDSALRELDNLAGLVLGAVAPLPGWHSVATPLLSAWGPRNQSLWWQCSVHPDHCWYDRVSMRRRRGCPYCTHDETRMVAFDDSLAAHPEVAKLYDTGASGIPAVRIRANSFSDVAWRCQDVPEHRWTGVVSVRVRHGATLCRLCKHKVASPSWNLATAHPELLELLAAGQDPADIAPTSDQQLSWSCPVAPDHRWTERLQLVAGRAAACPFCDGLRLSQTNNLATAPPAVLAALDATRNVGLDLSQVRRRDSRTQLWWSCPEGDDHVFQATAARIFESWAHFGRIPCGFCDGKRVSADNSLAACFPDIAAQLADDLNGGVRGQDVTQKSGKALWW